MKAQINRLYSDLFRHFAIVNYINKIELNRSAKKGSLFHFGGKLSLNGILVFIMRICFIYYAKQSRKKQQQQK